MKSTFTLLIAVALVTVSCKKEEIKTKVAAQEPIEVKECYEYIQGKDTVNAQILVNGLTASGTLEYKLFEKDKNTGTLVGSVIGDTLLADYSFMSEGIKSVRQVLFLRKNKTLVEGFGESEEKEGKMQFINRKKLSFTSGLVLNEIPCK